jgi:DNA-binding GntR family transcriptional regulator
MASTAGWSQQLAADRAALDRGSTAERVADVLRTRITEGMFPPGTRLSEEALTGGLGVSRNTLREAFRLLSHERLLTHELNRGVFVRVLAVEDVADLYRVRRILEVAAVAAAADAAPEALERVRQALAEAETAAAEDRWFDVGTANMSFHQALAGLAGSPRVDETVRHLLAELRLVFHVMSAPREFHEPYLRENRRIYHLLAAGDVAGAAAALAEYLDAAEKQLTQAYAERGATGAPR